MGSIRYSPLAEGEKQALAFESNPLELNFAAVKMGVFGFFNEDAVKQDFRFLKPGQTFRRD